MSYPIVSTNAFTSHRSEVQITKASNLKSHMIMGVQSLSSSAPDLAVAEIYAQCYAMEHLVFNTDPDKEVRSPSQLREENITITDINRAPV